MKLSGNFLISSVIEALAEAMALVGKAGIDQHQYLDFLTSTLFAAPVYKTYGAIIADKKFSPAGFAAPLGFKDNRLVLAAAENLQVPLPIASLIYNRFLRCLRTVAKSWTGRRSQSWRQRIQDRGMRCVLLPLRNRNG